jgi:uncharacterized protein
MRLAYASDLHGNLGLYQALLTLAVDSNAQLVIVGGDLLPHASRVQQAIAVQRQFIVHELQPLLLAFRERCPDVPVLLLAGNDDWAASIEQLTMLEEQQLAYALHGRVVQIADLAVAGYACVPPTPFSIKDYERPDDGSLRNVSFGMAYSSQGDTIQPLSAFDFWQKPSIASELEALAQQSIPAATIYVCHTPPFNTPLDQMRGDRHVGSPALRAFIEHYQPPLTLHGHIHEAPELSGQYACRIGATWCINAGRDPNRLQAITVDTDDIEKTLVHTVFSR